MSNRVEVEITDENVFIDLDDGDYLRLTHEEARYVREQLSALGES